MNIPFNFQNSKCMCLSLFFSSRVFRLSEPRPRTVVVTELPPQQTVRARTAAAAVPDTTYSTPLGAFFFLTSKKKFICVYVLCLWLYVCLFICLFVCLFVFVCVCVCVCVCVILSVFLRFSPPPFWGNRNSSQRAS